MSGEPDISRRAGDGRPSFGSNCSDLDLHRIDLAARLLVLKQGTFSSEKLILHTAADAGVEASELDAARFIKQMIRISVLMPVSDDGARSLLAAERLAELIEALSDPEDIAVLRGLRRRGELERPLSLASQRRVRRGCWQMKAAERDAHTLEPLATSVWDGLLDALTLSLAQDPEAEVLADVALDGLDERGLAGRRARVRLAIARGERTPVTPGRPSPRTAIVVDEPTLVTGGGGGAWPPPERELLPAGHRVGRFTLLKRLGVGAMGVVYAAYDPELDRRIAVKLLRTREGPRAAEAQTRLVREAQAMARLAHPNVAVVHDVGTHEGDVFVAMELIRGATLHAWLHERPRSWRAVVEVFLQAGRGLAAAHAASLVHRDFKPTNAMIGDDGRVRVLDFGLCFTGAVGERGDEVAPAKDGPAATRRPLRITRHEEVLGTPAYMPPEQFAVGGVVGPASDQFSFCASLYEALYAQLPFTGETIADVMLAIARGTPRPPPRTSRVPGWLYAAVLRGMRPAQGDRFPSMDALLRVLERGRARARGGVLVAAALTLVAGAGGFWAARHGATLDPCSGGAAQMSAVWGAADRTSAERALGAAGPAFAAEVWPRVAAELDRYAGDWQGEHRAACEAHQRGESSDTLFDRRLVCLEQRRSALREAVKVLAEASPAVAPYALEVAHRLPELERCSDVGALEADLPPPSDPEQRAAVERQRPRLERVQSLEHAGLAPMAMSLADEVVAAAEQIGDRKLLSEALLERGRLGINRLVRARDQDELLTRAYLTALGASLDELATEALALRIYHRSREEGRTGDALEDLSVAREMVGRLPSPQRLDGLVRNNAGAVYMASGDLVRAAAMFREALAVREAALGPEHLEVAYTLANLAMVGPESERQQLFARALQIFDRQLGQAHPQNLELRLAASYFMLDPREARALIAPGCDALGRFASDPSQRMRCLGFLGHHASEAGDVEAASAAFLAIASLSAPGAATDLDMQPVEVAELRGYAALYTGDHTGAVALLRDALTGQRYGDEQWQRRHRAELELLLGLHRERLGDRAGAREALRAAVDGFVAASGAAPDILLQQRLARARAALAAVLLSDGASADRSTASQLLGAAEQWYRASGPGYEWRLHELELLRSAADLR